MNTVYQDYLSQRILVDQETGCWNWQNMTNNQGYGMARPPKTVSQMLVHRMAYVGYVGEIPEGMLVCHVCDNRKCCNPAHLFVGTHKQNTRDAMDKGRLSGCIPHIKQRKDK